ncbi:Co-chaperone Hsc20 [Hypoxylon argillaceum]|nr:Co-chaperone Hsc20 [Hypoxylon argillaceum]KAI1154822.1 Co-chaperone Hsc20 [Nemania diffusa]
MRPSLFPARQATRVCAFCQQQLLQQLRGITTVHSLQASSFSSSTRQHKASDLPLAPRSQSQAPHTPKSTTRRPFTSSARAQSSQPSASVSATADAAIDAKEKPHAPRTHYDFFPLTLPDGPPPHGPFHIDVRALRREFLGLQAGAHPDLHPAHLKGRAHATSARINEAYRALSSALPRAQHVLALRGHDVAADETGRVQDAALLALVLETRECIEEAEDEGELEALRAENDERVSESEDRLAKLFAADDLEGAKEEVVRLRYWMNVRESIDNWEKGKPVVLEH